MKKKEKLKDIIRIENNTPNTIDFFSAFGTFNLNSVMNGGNTGTGGGSTSKLVIGKATTTPHGSDYSVRTYDTDPAKAVTDGVYYPKDNFLYLYEKH